MEFPAKHVALSRRKVIVGGLALGAAPFVPRFLGMASGAPLAFGYPEPDTTSRIVRPIEFPVEGTVNWTDTYLACRDGCSRRHEGQDLLGHKLQKLVACVDGTVVGLKYDKAGNYLYLRDADGWHYGYLHINNDTPGTDDGANPRAWAFAPGIVVGAQVHKGQFIAYMGDSGNAEGTVPHCHYEIRKPADAWYHAQAVNAAYSLRAASHGGVSSVPTSTFSPWSTGADFAKQQYVDFLNRQPNAGELALWSAALNSGEKSPADLVDWVIGEPGSDNVISPLVRLYLGAFGRIPDTSGLMYWISRIRGGTSLDVVALTFTASAEFHGRYSAMSNRQFIDAMYLKIRGRASDAAGRAYWLPRLDSGTARFRLLREFVETDYYRYVTRSSMRICVVYAGMLRRAPDVGGHMYWLDKYNDGMPLQTMISTIQKSTSYRARFPTASLHQTLVPEPSGFTGTGAQYSPPVTAPPPQTTSAPPATRAPATTAPPTTRRPTTTRPTTTRAPATTAPPTTRAPSTTTTSTRVPRPTTPSTTMP